MEVHALITVFIAEDRQSSMELLMDYLMDRPELKLEGIAKNGEEALQKLSDNDYDLLFLDINLPIMSGIEVLKKLDVIPYVIFTTSYDKYAIKAFELGAVDYLLKPFSVERFNLAVDKAVAAIRDEKVRLDTPKKLGLSFKEGAKHYIIAYTDIVYFSSNARNTIIHTEGRDFETLTLLKDMVEKISKDIFIRIHKQFIVNLAYVATLEYMQGGQYEVTLKDEERTKLPVGQKFASDLKKKLTI